MVPAQPSTLVMYTKLALFSLLFFLEPCQGLCHRHVCHVQHHCCCFWQGLNVLQQPRSYENHTREYVTCMRPFMALLLSSIACLCSRCRTKALREHLLLHSISQQLIGTQKLAADLVGLMPKPVCDKTLHSFACTVRSLHCCTTCLHACS